MVASGFTSRADALALGLGQALKRRRKALGINVTSAAEAARISRVTWHRLEKGERSVALGSLLAAMEAVGLVLHSEESGSSSAPAPLPDGWLPLQVPLQQYPELRRLAWQVSDDLKELTAREAFGLYERNWRHLDVQRLSDQEKRLIHALQQAFGGRFDTAL